MISNNLSSGKYLPHWPIPSTIGNCKIDYETIFERMSIVLDNLGNPHKKLPPIIHIAGTNGKGSTAKLIAEVFIQANYKTHIYTSPHLHYCNERIILAGEMISNNFLFEVMEESRIAAKNVPLTFMEGFTIGAFLAFSKIDADILVMECGMGGRIDATNIIENKIASVITPISFDHTEYLGDSIEKIALEKSMIMRPKTPLIVASQPKRALEIIDILAKDQNLKTYYYDYDFEILLNEKNGEFDLRFEKEIIKNLPKPSLIGSHQYINFATAIATILVISNNDKSKFQIDENHIKKAVKSVSWQSRLEKVSNSLNKLLKNIKSEIFIDGAHNEAGAFALSKWILEENKKNFKETFIICGFSKNKCKKEFLEKFKNITNKVIAIKVEGEPYPEEVEVIYQIAKSIGLKIDTANDLENAIEIINADCQQPCRIIICGSLHLARDLKKY